MTPRLVYDADCGFCTRCAAWIAARWAPGSAEIVASRSLADPELEALGLSRAEVDAAAWWIGADGTALRGDRAIAAALRAAPGWTRPLGRVLAAPPLRWLAPAGYSAVARFRHRLPGGTADCAVTEPPA